MIFAMCGNPTGLIRQPCLPFLAYGGKSIHRETIFIEHVLEAGIVCYIISVISFCHHTNLQVRNIDFKQFILI